MAAELVALNEQNGACSPLVDNYSGKIVLILRGGCLFVQKVWMCVCVCEGKRGERERERERECVCVLLSTGERGPECRSSWCYNRR